MFSPGNDGTHSQRAVKICGGQEKRLSVELEGMLAEIASTTGCDDWQVRGSPLVRRECGIYFLRSASFRVPRLVLKAYGGDSVRALARKLDAKSRFYHAAGTRHCTVPEPILLLKGKNALVMEYVEAPLAGSLLRKGFHSRETRESINRMAGRWLEWFHARSLVSLEPFDASYFSGKLAALVGKSAAGGANPTEFGEWMEFAAVVAAGLDGVLVPHAEVHGDFTPFNLFIDGDRVTGFDYQVNRRLPITHDLCRFLLYLEAYRILPSRAADLREYGCGKADFEDFMRAYGADREWFENGLWAKLQFLEVARRMASLMVRRASWRNRSFRWIEMRCLCRNARLMMEALR